MIVTSRMFRVAVAAFALSGPMVALTGCERKEGPAEELGEAVDDAVDNAKDAADDATGAVKDVVDDARDAVH